MHMQKTLIKFNQGQTLLHLANMYPTLLEVILELVQNALDKDVNANRVWITVNYQTRYLAVRDNGAGCSISKFAQALASVADRKRKGEGSIGQFGIGLISPLGKCKEFVFTSCPEPENFLYHEWNFGTDEVVAQRDQLFIPNRNRYDYVYVNKVKGRKTVEWRSEMALNEFTEDAFISRVAMDTLVASIQERYNLVMRRNKVKISIRITHKDGSEERREDVTAVEFRGRKLEEREVVSEDAGKVLFRMYIAPKSKTGRKGKVLMGVMGNDFRFPFQYLTQSTTALLQGEVVQALTSGLFEGEIIVEKVKLHANRSTFEKDDAFISMCIAMESWFNEHGRQYIEDARQSRQDERFQELGLRSMKVLEDLLEDPAHSPLRDVIKSFAHGNVGVGHTESDKVLGEQEKKSLSASNGNVGVPRKSNGKEQTRQTPEQHKPGHMPLTVTGPKGETRKVVRGHSMGLAFSYDPMEGSPDLWKLDTKLGVLHFNIRHSLWVTCDERSDKTLMVLQEYIAIQALTLQTLPENLREGPRKLLEELNPSMVSWFLKADKARGSIPSRPKQEKAKKDE